MVAETKNIQSKTDGDTIKKILLRESEFVKNLLSLLPIPTSALQGKDDPEESKHFVKFNIPDSKNKRRAQSLTELQERLKSVQSIKKLNYKDKLLKKGLKNRLKKKTKQEQRHLKQKLVRIEKSKDVHVLTKQEPNPIEENVKTPKPVFNRDGKIVFSKFDFSGLGSMKNDKKNEKDPKKILKNLEKQKIKLTEMQQNGDADKVKEMKQKHAWKMALAKSEGLKVKDDPILLKKTIKKKEQQRKGSAKKWQVRQDGVNKAQEMKQQRRTENIEKRKKEKKNKKLKQASNRGRIIPGF